MGTSAALELTILLKAHQDRIAATPAGIFLQPADSRYRALPPDLATRAAQGPSAAIIADLDAGSGRDAEGHLAEVALVHLRTVLEVGQIVEATLLPKDAALPSPLEASPPVSSRVSSSITQLSASVRRLARRHSYANGRLTRRPSREEQYLRIKSVLGLPMETVGRKWDVARAPPLTRPTPLPPRQRCRTIRRDSIERREPPCISQMSSGGATPLLWP